MQDYQIKWIGTDGDYYPLRRCDALGQVFKPTIHVFHIMQGSLLGTDEEFNSRKVDAATHYGIGKNGEIHQYVKDEDGAWGQGFVSNPSWFGNQLFPGVNPNYYCICYELEGFTGDVPTEAQWAALMYLVKLKSAAYNTPKDSRYYVGHYIIDPQTRPDCPGKGFPWARLYSDLGITAPVLTPSMPVLSQGSKGTNVNYLQTRLNAKGFNCGTPDGDFGPNTRAAVIKLQHSKGLKEDGIVGPATWTLLV